MGSSEFLILKTVIFHPPDPSGYTESPCDNPQRQISKHMSPFLVFFCLSYIFAKPQQRPGNLKSSPASVTSSSKSLWHFFFSFPYCMFLKKRERKKTFLPHITLLPQFQCRLLCWVVASNASVSAKNYQMQITHKNAGSKTVSNNGWKCKFRL